MFPCALLVMSLSFAFDYYFVTTPQTVKCSSHLAQLLESHGCAQRKKRNLLIVFETVGLCYCSGCIAVSNGHPVWWLFSAKQLELLKHATIQELWLWS